MTENNIVDWSLSDYQQGQETRSRRPYIMTTECRLFVRGITALGSFGLHVRVPGNQIGPVVLGNGAVTLSTARNTLINLELCDWIRSVGEELP